MRGSRCGKCREPFGDIKLSHFEIPATWYRISKQAFQKSAGGGAGTGAGKNGGAGRSAGTGAGRLGPLGKQRQNSLPAPVPALQPAPPFLPAPVPAPPPALFWNSRFGVLYQVAGISSLTFTKEMNAKSAQNFRDNAPLFARQSAAAETRFEGVGSAEVSPGVVPCTCVELGLFVVFFPVL